MHSKTEEVLKALESTVTDVLYGRKLDRVGNRNDDGMDMARIGGRVYYPDWWYDHLCDVLSRIEELEALNNIPSERGSPNEEREG